MNIQLKYILILLIFSSSLASAATDYDAQFKHSAQRWLQAVEYYRTVSKPIGLIYLCKNIEGRNRLSEKLHDYLQIKEEEQTLGYENRLVVYYFEKPSQKKQLAWLRKNFNLGLTYNCDMNGFQ